jgi:hypothetical protein
MIVPAQRSKSVAVGLAAAALAFGLAAVFHGVPAAAQTPFALANIGQRSTTEDARMVGRGGWGMAVHDSLDPGFKNLSSLSSLRHLVLKFTGYGDQMKSEDAFGDRTNTKVLAPDVRLAGPVIKDRLALTAGLVVNRTTQYHTLADTLWTEVWGDTISGNQQFTRIGNRFRVPLGAAWKVLPGLSVSGAVNLEAGSLKGTINNFFTNPSGPGGPFYQTNVKETYDEFHGTSQTWGILVEPFSWLQAGASWTPAHKIEADRVVTHYGVSSKSPSTYTMQMPGEYLAGIQLHPLDRWRLGADVQFQPFSEFTGPAEWMADLQDEYGFAVGLERMKGHVRRGGLSNLPLRVGFSFRRWAYAVGGTAAEAAAVDEKMFSLGTGFPFRQNLGELDVALSYGLIGDLEKNGVESSILRLTISVTGLESWW